MPVKPKIKEEDFPDIVDEVADEIAKLDLRIEREAKPWAGKSALVDKIASKANRADAERVVQAAADQFWAEAPDSNPRVELRKALRRLGQLRNIAYDLMSKPRLKRKFNCTPRMRTKNAGKPNEEQDYERDAKGEIKYDRVITEEIEERGVDIALIDRIVQIEGLIAKWTNLAQRGDPTFMRQILEHLEKQSDGSEGGEESESTTATLSIAQTVKRSIPAKRTRQITATVLPPQIIPPNDKIRISEPIIDPVIERPAEMGLMQTVEPASEPVGTSELTIAPGPPPDASAEPFG